MPNVYGCAVGEAVVVFTVVSIYRRICVTDLLIIDYNLVLLPLHIKFSHLKVLNDPDNSNFIINFINCQYEGLPASSS